MPDPEIWNRHVEMAEGLINDLRIMDELGFVGDFSIQNAVNNVQRGYIHFVWVENQLYLQGDEEYLKHIQRYPDGWLASMLRHTVNLWVMDGSVDLFRAMQDYALI